jgi:hypothetical protein
MGSSHSSEPSQPLEVENVEEVEVEVETEVEEEEDPVDDFLENSIRWMFGIA